MHEQERLRLINLKRELVKKETERTIKEIQKIEELSPQPAQVQAEV